jgi:hypothetical protein
MAPYMVVLDRNMEALQFYLGRDMDMVILVQDKTQRKEFSDGLL